MKDYYAILGVARTAKTDEISKAYRKAAKKTHPDINQNDPQAAEKFKELQEAYDVLSNSEKRANYDQFGTADAPQKPFASSYDDFFSFVFNGGAARTAKGDDVLFNLTLTLDQVLKGGEVDIIYRRRHLCDQCKGSGGQTTVCPDCKGSGAHVVQGPNLTVKAPCKKCQATGQIIEQACGSCAGGFTEPKEESVKFQIPVGVEHWMQFVHKGQGEPCRNGRNGNLVIRVSVADHKFFRRLEDAGILLELPVNYTQLVLGDTIEVPTLESKVKLKIPPGTQPGSKFRLKNLGLPVFTNSPTIYSRGDMYVLVSLEVPVEPDASLREILQTLSQYEKEHVTPAKKEFLKELGENNE